MHGPNRGRISAVVVVLVALLAVACGEGIQTSDQTTEVTSVGHTAPEHSAAIESARGIVRSVMEQESIPGLSVAVAKGSQVLWSEGFGYSDLTHQVNVTPLTGFRIGSVSKPITAAALGVLVERSALDLDAPVQDYVPSFPEKRWPVTTRQLAGHLGGIRHYQGDEFFSAVNYPDVLSGLAIFEKDPLIHEPGTEYFYSSFAWNLISAVVEGASGESFLDFMQREVLDALEMDHTVADRNRPIVANRTRFYVLDDEGEVVNAPYVDKQLQVGGGRLSVDTGGTCCGLPTGIWRPVTCKPKPSSFSSPRRRFPMARRRPTASAGGRLAMITANELSRTAEAR